MMHMFQQFMRQQSAGDDVNITYYPRPPRAHQRANATDRARDDSQRSDSQRDDSQGGMAGQTNVQGAMPDMPALSDGRSPGNAAACPIMNAAAAADAMLAAMQGRAADPGAQNPVQKGNKGAGKQKGKTSAGKGKGKSKGNKTTGKGKKAADNGKKAADKGKKAADKVKQPKKAADKGKKAADKGNKTTAKKAVPGWSMTRRLKEYGSGCSKCAWKQAGCTLSCFKARGQV